ncbi:hypothetical protein CMK12_09675 [Candidatus Poribacteria bacterium]|nr:hypothetical protein [Candidatus Poribacteria bacterium]MDP6746856.1 hypothetical protein [Candidatus Poribacteria bacterium]MDP6997131.1 hypothetical protein [Candidatus Poribacteria bacterium]
MRRQALVAIAIGTLSVLFLLIIPRIVAQVNSSTKPSIQDEIRRHTNILKGWQLIDAIGPTAEQAALLLTKFKRLEDLKAKSRTQRIQTFNLLKELAEEEGRTEDKKRALAAYRENSHQAELAVAYNDIYTILDVDQQVKFAVFNRTFRRDLHDTLKVLASIRELKAQEKVEKK